MCRVMDTGIVSLYVAKPANMKFILDDQLLLNSIIMFIYQTQ